MTGPLSRVGRRLALLCLCLLPAVLMPGRPTVAQAGPPDPRFGIVETYANPAAASEAGAGYTRIILRWDVIQPASRDDWKPANVPDPLIEGELTAGRQVVGLLIGTPAWARAAPAEDDQRPPSSRDVPDMFQWEAFVRKMAQQYRGRIGHWVIWNEPDVWQEGHPGRTWEGSEADYATLLKTAYLAIKDVDPSMEVHLAGLTYYWDWEHGRRRYLDRLLEIIAADPEAAAHDFYFDAVVYHLYFNPSQTADVIRETRQTLNRYGMAGKAIWINETNAPPSEDPEEPPWSAPRFRVSLEEQAAFVLQQFAVAFAAGAGRVEFYKLQNSAGHPESIEPFGLLRADGTRRPAFTAFQVATTYLGNFRTARREDQGDVTAVTFDRGDGTTTVLWTGSRGDRQARVNAISPSALLVDERGNTTELAAVDGAYTVALPGAICTQQTSCFIGGAPRLLVEAGSPAGRPALAEPPPATPASNPTPAPSPSSTATPTTKATPPPAPTATPTRTLAPTATPAQSPTAPRATRPPAPTPTAAVIPATPSPSPTGAAIPEPAGQEPGTSPDRSGILAIAGMAAVAIAGGLGLIRRRR